MQNIQGIQIELDIEPDVVQTSENGEREIPTRSKSYIPVDQESSVIQNLHIILTSSCLFLEKMPTISIYSGIMSIT